MAKKKTAAKKKKAATPKTVRYASQVAREIVREENDVHGKTLVRHTKESAAAMKRVMRRLDCSGPEALRLGVVELAAKGN